MTRDDQRVRLSRSLDVESALQIVLEQLRLGMVVNPALVPRAVTWIRREVDALTASGSKKK